MKSPTEFLVLESSQTYLDKINEELENSFSCFYERKYTELGYRINDAVKNQYSH